MIPFAMGLDALIALFKRYRWLMVAAPLAIGLGLQTWRLNSARADLLEKQATISNMKLASEAARQAQIALNQATEAAYKAESERTDHAYQVSLNDARNRYNGYATANRVRAYCEGGTGQANSAAQGDLAQGGDGAGADAILLSPADFQILNENTLRLKAVNEWGQRLIEQGLAVQSQAATPETR